MARSSPHSAHASSIRCHCGTNGGGTRPKLMLKGVLKACEGPDVRKHVTVEDTRDSGMSNAGNLREAAQREPACLHRPFQVTGEQQAAVRAQGGIRGQGHVGPRAFPDVEQRVLVVVAAGHDLIVPCDPWSTSRYEAVTLCLAVNSCRPAPHFGFHSSEGDSVIATRHPSPSKCLAHCDGVLRLRLLSQRGTGRVQVPGLRLADVAHEGCSNCRCIASGWVRLTAAASPEPASDAFASPLHGLAARCSKAR